MNILNQLFLAVILGLGGWIWYQGSTIDEMTAENQAQAQTIKQQEEANQALNLALQQERDAVIEQQQRNEEIERMATENAESIKTIIKTQPCANTRLPQSALDRLRK
ncbi:DUF2570 family protein [Aggregatibacter kilianii]|jgi:hypothetical protein|uniref:DUF2570 family protein n=1 Tax=Aggregatibacter kilianii TaxID=2025884 RepID=UPI00206C0C40|nr:DUF2570 family protein [Aggregatibacter kilianii]DAN75139.1 MAG TPA: Protein of unknown function (DUF2570) [Bacteriophage sp.]